MLACLLFSTMSESMAQGLLSGGNSLKPKSVIRLWGDCPLVSCSMLLA